MTFCVNSVTHIIGKKRFKNSDESRNNWWVALLTFGEGWHNNHHRYPHSARQGMYWWEFDLTFLLLQFWKVGMGMGFKGLSKNHLSGSLLLEQRVNKCRIGYHAWYFFLWQLLARCGFGTAENVHRGFDLVPWAGAGATLIFLDASSENASNLRAYLALGLVLAWSIRLSGHLFFNRVLKENEDARYQRLIEHAGRHWKAVFLFLFLMQVVLIYVFLIPIRTAIESPILALAWHDWLALCIGILALIGETISDNQLKEFSIVPENEGKVCKSGFWRYSRHPNYFFEWLFWWAFVFFSRKSILSLQFYWPNSYVLLLALYIRCSIC